MILLFFKICFIICSSNLTGRQLGNEKKNLSYLEKLEDGHSQFWTDIIKDLENEEDKFMK